MSGPARVALRENLGWTIAGNLLYAGCQWGMLVLIARLGTPAMVGDFAFALALAAPVLVLAMLNLRAAQATDQRGEYAFADYVHLRVVCLAAAGTVLAAILIAGRFGRATVWTVVLVAAAKACDALSDVVYGLLQQREWMKRIAISRVLQGLLQLAALGLALAATGSLIAATAAMAAASLAVTVLYDVASVRAVGRREPGAARPLSVLARPDRRALVRLLGLSLPLGLAAALDSFNASVPRYALDAGVGREALGYYAALAYFLIGQGTIVTAVADVARPRLARAHGAASEEFLGLTARLAIAAGGCAVAGVVLAYALGADLLRLLYGESYAAQTRLLVWIMVAAIPWNLSGIVTTAIGAARHFRAVLLCFVAMTVVTAVASAALVPANGALGAAWALGLGMVARLAVGSAILWRLYAARGVTSRLAGAMAG